MNSATRYGKEFKGYDKAGQAAHFKSKDYCGEQLKVVMDAVSYGISAGYLQLFEDTTIPVETMEIMFTAMKEDYGGKRSSMYSCTLFGVLYKGSPAFL